MCPVTEQPDLSHRRDRVRARPNGASSRRASSSTCGASAIAPVFAEALAAEIAGEIMTTAQPNCVTVTLTQRPRGGIEVQAVAELTR